MDSGSTEHKPCSWYEFVGVLWELYSNGFASSVLSLSEPTKPLFVFTVSVSVSSHIRAARLHVIYSNLLGC